MDLRKLILSDESETSEFKESTGEWKEIIETVSAFSNTRGGKIIVGISNRDKANGVDIGQDTIEDLTNKISQNTDPKIHPGITVGAGLPAITVGAGLPALNKRKKIIIIEVRESPDHLVLAFGRPYKRVGRSTLKMSKDEYERLILEKHKEKLYFDKQTCKNISLKEIAMEKVKLFLKKAKEERNLNIDSQISLKEALKKLNLMSGNKITNAAILMFGNNPQKFFIQSEVRCARFKGEKAVKPFIDMKVITGTVYEQIDQAEKFVLFNIKKAAWTEPGKIERQEKWEYPPDALREAITNAIVHRDYNSSANAHISIFDDRIEIWNPGNLPPALTLADLKKEHKSIPVNPSLANLLFLIKYIEKWGTGTNDIMKWCAGYGLPEPLFSEVAGGFTVILRKFQIYENPELVKLSDRQKKAMEYLKINKKITNRVYHNLCPDVNRETLRKDLRDLVNRKIITKKGEKRGIYYETI